MDRDEAEVANERIATMAEELRKAELVRDRLEGLNRLMGSYPEDHNMRACLGTLHLERALDEVEEDIRLLTDASYIPARPETPQAGVAGYPCPVGGLERFRNKLFDAQSQGFGGRVAEHLRGHCVPEAYALRFWVRADHRIPDPLEEPAEG